MRLILLRLIQGYPYQIFFCVKDISTCMYVQSLILSQRCSPQTRSTQKFFASKSSTSFPGKNSALKVAQSFCLFLVLVVADKGFGLSLSQLFKFWFFASLLTHITQGPYTKCSQLQGLKKCHFPPAKVTKWSSKRGSKSLCWIKLKTSKCQTCQEFLLGQYQIMRCDLKVLQPLVFEDTRIEWYLIFQ